MNKEDLQTAIIQFVFEFGYIPLDLRIRLNHGSYEIHFSIFKKGNITMQDCSRVTLAVKDFLEHLLGSEDFIVDVSSPGADRVLKKPEEFSLFEGRKARIILKNGSEFIGIISGYFAETDCVGLLILPEKDEKKILVSEVGKCQLLLD